MKNTNRFSCRPTPTSIGVALALTLAASLRAVTLYWDSDGAGASGTPALTASRIRRRRASKATQNYRFR